MVAAMARGGARAHGPVAMRRLLVPRRAVGLLSPLPPSQARGRVGMRAGSSKGRVCRRDASRPGMGRGADPADLGLFHLKACNNSQGSFGIKATRGVTLSHGRSSSKVVALVPSPRGVRRDPGRRWQMRALRPVVMVVDNNRRWPVSTVGRIIS